MTRTGNHNGDSCALVLQLLLTQLQGNGVASAYVRSKPELAFLRTSAQHALAGETLRIESCARPGCHWMGAFREPVEFRCERCGNVHAVETARRTV